MLALPTLVEEGLGDRGCEVGAGRVDGAEVVARGRSEYEASTASKPVPSSGSCSVPSPSFDFSALTAPNKSVSNAKSLREAAMDRDISHGENACPDLVYSDLYQNE